MYTYGCPTLNDTYNNSKKEPNCGGFMLQSIHGNRSSRKPRQLSRKDSISFYKKPTLPANKVKLLLCTFPFWLSKLDFFFSPSFGLWVHHDQCDLPLECEVVVIGKCPMVRIPEVVKWTPIVFFLFLVCRHRIMNLLILLLSFSHALDSAKACVYACILNIDFKRLWLCFPSLK